MSRHVVKLPDLGEGTVSSEIVAWHVKVGDDVKEDQPMVEMSTDKAVVEMPSPVSGRVVSLGGQPGDHIAVGAELIVLETSASGAAAESASKAAPAGNEAAPASQSSPAKPAASKPAAAANEPEVAAGAKASGRVMASPATRRRARESGIDLALVTGTGRDGRIQKQDLDAVIGERTQGKAPAVPAARADVGVARTETEEIRILGVRRVSAQRVSDSKRNIPHFAYVEEVDITELERLRRHLNSRLPKGAPGYTYLPFVAMALVRVIEQFPKVNAQYDAERNVLIQHRGIHMGIATQTSDGLKVPVVRHVEALSLAQIAPKSAGCRKLRATAPRAATSCAARRSRSRASASSAASSRRRSSMRRKSRSSASTRRSSGPWFTTVRSPCD